MDSTLVSARVPRAKKEAGKAVLDDLGATVSDLINGAFDHLLEKKELPGSHRPSHRTAVDFASFLEKSTLTVNWEPDDVDYDKAVRDGKLSDYESLTRH